ncbi:hypothetical protein DM194_23990 (plasmid) [Azospirillum ramasamyi]|uniref:Uncharacterized protein n=1 Tax=Azospirillum ramasamyi TaxID=682998 RepID=A0A2U9SJ66_9PROT|nr:hypothetical protein DM194_23990 [Azospirillum ramasamyi]
MKRGETGFRGVFHRFIRRRSGGRVVHGGPFPAIFGMIFLSWMPGCGKRVGENCARLPLALRGRGDPFRAAS